MRRTLVLSLILLASAVHLSFAEPTDLKAGVVLKDIGSHAAPAVADWNNDGSNDILSGRYNSYNDGKIMLYLNQNSSAEPLFSSFSYLQNNGSDITLSAY